MRGLVAVVEIRGSGTAEDASYLRQLTRHLRALGKRELPLLRLGVEKTKRIEHWLPSRRIALRERPYSLKVVELV